VRHHFSFSFSDKVFSNLNANFNSFIPGDILFQNYKFVVDISFDEAEWIFINPVKILG